MAMKCFAGIVTVSVGHSHPRVVSALQEQAARLGHSTTIYLNDQVALYGKELAEKMPGKLKARGLSVGTLDVHACEGGLAAALTLASQPGDSPLFNGGAGT